MFTRDKLPKSFSTAAASDGGSTAVIMCEQNDKESLIILDKKLTLKPTIGFFMKAELYLL